MSGWIDSKIWQALLAFSCISLFVGIKFLPAKVATATPAAAKAVYSKPAPGNSPSTSSKKSKPLRQQSLDQTFDFSISTRLSIYPSGTEVHLIGVHQGDDGKKKQPWHSKCAKTKDGRLDPTKTRECHSKWAGYRATQPVQVNVNLSSPSILVFMAVEPVIWTIRTDRPDLIKKVILAGLNAQVLTGLSGDTPVDISTQQSSPTCNNCSLSGLTIPAAYDKRHKSYDDVLTAIKIKTGLDSSTFQGSKKASQFTISDRTPRISSQSLASKFKLEEGDVIDKSYRNYFNISNLQIPLPEGTWKGLIYQSIAKGEGEDLALVFYQVRKSRLQGIYAVRLRQSADGGGFSKKNACNGKIGYSNVVDINENYGDQLCYWVEHLTSIWEAPLFDLSAKRLEKRGIKVPSVVVNSAFHMADNNKSITSYYLTNPEIAGIDTQPSSWLTSPWHPRKLKSDQVRQRFVDDKVEWMDAWYQVLRAVNANRIGGKY